MTRERRTAKANEYRKLYQTKQWAHLRNQALFRDRFRCQYKGCGVVLVMGKRTPNAAVVHHIKAHKGNLDLFYNIDNLQSVCKHHHDGVMQSEERLGYDKTIGEDGWPTSPTHPASGG